MTAKEHNKDQKELSVIRKLPKTLHFSVNIQIKVPNFCDVVCITNIDSGCGNVYESLY